MQMPTALLPRAFEHVGHARKFTVLDLGSPTSASVRFFNQFNCRVHFAGLLDPDEDEDEDGLGLQVPSHVRFDVCLFWDVLNYLEADVLHSVLEVVTARLGESCRAHGFLAFSQAVSFSGLRFGIEAVDRLRVECGRNPVPHVRTWRDVETALWPLANAAATLLQGNRQELLLINQSS